MLTATLLALGLAVQGEPPQPPPQPPAESGAQPRPPAYDTSRERTLQGAVESVDIRSQGPGRMVTLNLRVDSAAWRIVVGPEEVLARQGVSFAAGDALSVLGAPTDGPDGTVFLARQITRNGVTWTFLDASGRPASGAKPPSPDSH